jgi:hypothetical protein
LTYLARLTISPIFVMLAVKADLDLAVANSANPACSAID